MKAESSYILMELLFSGSLLAFAWWQVRLMRRDRLERERKEMEEEEANG